MFNIKTLCDKTLTRVCAFNEILKFLGCGKDQFTPPTPYVPYNAGKRNHKHFDTLIMVAPTIN